VYAKGQGALWIKLWKLKRLGRGKKSRRVGKNSRFSEERPPSAERRKRTVRKKKSVKAFMNPLGDRGNLKPENAINYGEKKRPWTRGVKLGLGGLSSTQKRAWLAAAGKEKRGVGVDTRFYG